MTTEPTPILDDLTAMQSVDRRNMLRLIRELPEQCETAMGIARSLAIEPLDSKPSVIYITGTGDSGLAVDMAAAALAEDTDVPVVTDRGGRLPGYIGEGAVVIVVDYAGKNQALARACREAKTRGANVICVTSGGKLLETASKEGVKTVKIPPGQPTRTAIGYLFVPLVGVIEKLGLAEGATERLSHAVKLLKNVREALRADYPSARNIAKQTAEALLGKMIVVYGAPGYRTSVAARWRSQIGANSKLLAMTDLLPDAAEGSISGWELSEKQAGAYGVVVLRDATDKGEAADVAEAAVELLGKHTVLEIQLKGATTIERLFYGIYLADYVSVYLAFLQEVDPSHMESVSYIESRMAAKTIPVAEAVAEAPAETPAE